MPRGALLARLFGTNIFATSGFLLLMALMLILYREDIAGVAAWEVALIVSILVHEFGHVFAVRWLTGKGSIVVLWGLGGLCIHEPTPVIRKRIGISLMGPAFGLALGVICWVAWEFWLPEGLHPAVAVFMSGMIIINIFYTLLNLLPILPLDGGQATLAALEWKLPPPRALRITRRISVVAAALGLAAVAVAFPRAPFLMLILGLLLAQNLFAGRHGV